MTDWHLAQLNVAHLRQPLDHPDTADFVAGLDPINARAEQSPGFVWRLQDESGNATGIESPGDPDRILNLSVWESVETLREFTRSSDHIGFVRRRLEWFEPREGPHLVLWWVPRGHRPTTAEADDRLARLALDGPTEDAFTFASAFSPPASGPPSR